MPLRSLLLILFLTCPISEAVSAPAPPSRARFKPLEIDSRIEIGYGVAVADVDGDRKPDIVLADKKQLVWYQNPGWKKYLLAEGLTELDNVCLAALDLNNDGKAEIAIGAGWNPADTVNSGAVFYLLAPADRTQKWRPLKLHHEPTVHRMRWVHADSGSCELLVLPLHGRGNQNGTGAGVNFLSYRMPSDPEQPWATNLINNSLHLTHNFDVVRWSSNPAEQILLAAKEGVFLLSRAAGAWKSQQLTSAAGAGGEFKGAGEVRGGKLGRTGVFVATIEPMHGNQVVLYRPPHVSQTEPWWSRLALDASLREGHALACGDLLGVDSDQIVVGWRGRNEQGKFGIKLFIPLDRNGDKWREESLDDNGIACEDLCLADLNGDSKLDIVAAGRATRNVKIYFNETTAAP